MESTEPSIQIFSLDTVEPCPPDSSIDLFVG
jgi:hypothetical protein